MKTFQIQLLRSARSTRLKPRPIAFNLVTENKAKTFGNTRNFSVTARRKTEDDDEMAPKGQKFELKTPKGTKDCESGSKPRANWGKAHNYQGRERIW